jgi:hypothetical protein
MQAQKKPRAEISRRDNRVISWKAKQRRWARRYVQCKTWLAATYNLLSCLRSSVLWRPMRLPWASCALILDAESSHQHTWVLGTSFHVSVLVVTASFSDCMELA